MTKAKRYLIILSLLITVSISSFFWLSSLVVAFENGHASHAQLNYISKFGLRPMLYERFATLSNKDKKWLNIAKSFAKTDGNVAFILAKYYLENQRNEEAKLWFSQAIRLKHHKARLHLAKIYLENSKNKQAKALLQPIENDILALQLLMKLAIREGDSTLIARYNRLFKQQNLVNHSTQKNLYQKLEKYSVINNVNINLGKTCAVTIAPFATNLKNLDYLVRLTSSPKLAAFLPYLCFTPVRYISKQMLNCDHDEDEAIRCDESIWYKKLDEISLKPRYLAILVDKGGANVNSGILYLDANDTEKVFLHELAHLLGFIDEYPLPIKHLRCLGKQTSMFSHNIAVLPRVYHGSQQFVRAKILAQLPWAKYIANTTPLTTKTEKGWVIGTTGGTLDTVGAFIAESCNGSNLVSVKPVNHTTAMRYFEETIPALYLQLLSDNPRQFLMPSYTKNVKIALKGKNNAEALFSLKSN